MAATFVLASGPSFAQTYYYPQFNSPPPSESDAFAPPQSSPAVKSYFYEEEAPSVRSDYAPRIQNLDTGRDIVRQKAARRSLKRIARHAPSYGAAVSQSGPPSFAPDTAALTRQAAARYAQIVRAGGWPRIPAAVGPGSVGPDVALLRQRLAAEGYLGAEGQLDAASADQSWTPELTAAVKKFQASVGLGQTGSVSGATLKELNIPAAERYRQLISTAGRLDAAKFPFGNLYVAVNIPAETVEAVADGKLAHRYIAVVGGPDHRSPEIAAKIQAINVNPTWTVPTSIIKHEIIPRLRRDPGYLAREHIRVLDPSGREVDPRDVNWDSGHALAYTLRQESGPNNSLGSLRINMPNNEAVYMHDTPAKSLFDKSYRFLSHGCVRVDGVYDLAAWLLRSTGDSHWSRNALLSAVATGERRDINLHRPVPVIWVYMTGWADRDGSVHFRNDVYHEDKAPEEMVHAGLQ